VPLEAVFCSEKSTTTTNHKKMTTTNTAADATAAIDTCLRDHFCWQPEAILIDGGLDKPPIDVMEAFCYDDPVNFGGKFVFPPDVYPPTWEDRKKLEDAIINAALIHSKTQLIRLKTITTKLQNGTMVTELGCYKGRRYYSSVKGKNLTSNDIYNSTAGNEENVPVYKDGIRQDRLVNKDKANRSRDKGKGAGKKDPRRTNTKKPPLGLICKFKIRLILVPGKHWFIHKSTKDKVKHNHSKLDKEEMVLRTSHLSNEDRDKLVLYKQYTNGGAATNLINSQLGGFNLSQDQVRGAAEKRQEETQELPEIDGTSHANKLVALLKKLSAQGHLKFIALFHEIQDTSLVAVSKYHQKKEEAERKKRKEAAEALVELSQVDDAPTKINLDVVGSNVGPSTGPQIQLQSPEDELSLGMILEPIRDRLKVGQKVLLAAAWARNDERRLFEMFRKSISYTGNLRQDAIAVLNSLMNRLEHNPELSGSTMSDYFEFMGTLHRKLDRSTRSKADDQGEFVNPFPEKTDTRRRWKRKKNAAEPRREKKWEKDKTRLSIDSLI
jgi:hypothetical protein